MALNPGLTREEYKEEYNFWALFTVIFLLVIEKTGMGVSPSEGKIDRELENWIDFDSLLQSKFLILLGWVMA